MNPTIVEIKFLDKELYAAEGGGFNPPKYASNGAAAFDLIVAENAIIRPGESIKLKSGVAFHIINEAVVGLVMPRSGLGSKGLVIGNLTGVIDSDYQGECFICAWNRTSGDFAQTFTVKRGDRLAQFLLVPVFRADFEAVEEFTAKTERGEAGFGSTGIETALGLAGTHINAADITPEKVEEMRKRRDQEKAMQQPSDPTHI